MSAVEWYAGLRDWMGMAWWCAGTKDRDVKYEMVVSEKSAAESRL